MDDIMKQVSELFSIVLNDYYSYFQLKPVDVEIILAEKNENIYRKKRLDLFEGENDMHFEDDTEERGLTIPPRTRDGKFTIVINKNYLFESIRKQDWQWVGTLTHEMTHVIDFINYAKMNDLNNFDVVQKAFIHRPFMLWTEFHAKATGYFFIRKFVFREKCNDKSDRGQTDYILNKELPFQINSYLQRYEAANGNINIQLYETMQFMGRYFVWETLFPNIFNEVKRQQVFGSNPWMIDMYEFLFEHKDIQSANGDFDCMQDIIKINFGEF